MAVVVLTQKARGEFYSADTRAIRQDLEMRHAAILMIDEAEVRHPSKPIGWPYNGAPPGGPDRTIPRLVEE